jgi:hypothetical protein
MSQASAEALEPASLVSTGWKAKMSVPAWSAAAAFGAYFCMYAFRKPFTAGTYLDESLGGVGYKTVLVTAQVLGYTVSKFVGIKVVSEMTPPRRVAWLLGLIGFAELALLLFALVPPPFSAACLFLNGLPLGMVFGLVLGFLEGRRQSEAMTAGLCSSFIVADGVVKSVGAYLLQAGVTEYWMPFLAGLLFVPPLLLFAWMLTRIPAPSREDIAERSARAPMNRDDRRQFFRRYAPGLTLLMLSYLLVTVLRSVRADFAPEIWAGLGTTGQPGVFAQSEMVVGLAVVLLGGLAVFIRDNRRAFFAAMALSLSGLLLVGVALLGVRAGVLGAFAFMVLHGLGLYLPYVVVHTTLFERLIAMTRDRGNIGYLMYLADAFGYLGYVAVMFSHNLFVPQGNFLDFFVALSGAIAGACALMLIPCWRYFAVHPATQVSRGVDPGN